MRVIDLSWPITDGMTVFPGDTAPVVTVITTVERDGFAGSLITIGTHTGTHIDSPAHMTAGGKTLDEMPGESFFGLAQVVDATAFAGREIGASDIKALVKDDCAVDFILINTGWSAKWGEDSYLHGYPVLSRDAALWLTSRSLKGIGVDAVSVDKTDDAEGGIHKIFMERELLIIENLRNLDQPGGGPFCLAALPLPLKNADGAPARVMAVLE